MDSITELKTTAGQIAGILRGSILDIRKHQSHYVRKYKGFALSPETIEQAENAGASILKLTIIETGKVYECSLDELKRYAIPDNLGAGLQLFMPVSYFRWCRAHSPAFRNQPQQIGMFEGGIG